MDTIDSRTWIFELRLASRLSINSENQSELDSIFDNFTFGMVTELSSRAGIDGGGVFKEFFTSLCKEVFDTDRGLWLANKKNEIYPNPHLYATERKSSVISTLFSPWNTHALVSFTLSSSTQPQLVSIHRSHSGEGTLRRYSG